MRWSPKDDECRNPTNRWENVSFPLIPTSPCLTVEIFTGSSLHAGWDWEGPWGRGTPRNFPTTSVSDPENSQSFFLSFGVVVAPALFCDVQEFTLSGWRHSEKFWRSDLNILSSIPSPFSADRGLGALSGDPEPRQTKLQPFSPLLGLAVLNFPLQEYHHKITNLISFWRGVALIPQHAL